MLVRKFTGQKYISAVDRSIPLLEARGYALNITNRFEKVLNKTAIQSGISVTNLNFDPVTVQSAIIGKIMKGRFSEIAKILYSFVKEACPKSEKFLSIFKCNIEKMCDEQEIVNSGYQPNDIADNKPRSYLNNTTVDKQLQNSISSFISPILQKYS